MREKLHVRTKKHLYTYVSMFLLMTAFSLTANAQLTLNHSWTFESDFSDSVNGAKTTVYGTPFVADGALNLVNNGDYLGFDGFELAFSDPDFGYTAITMEYVFSSAPTDNQEWTWTGYFGNDGGGNALYTALSHWDDEFRCTYNANQIEIFEPTIANNDGFKHHIVVVLTGTELTVFKDGVLVQSKVNETGSFTIGTEQAWLGKGSNAWSGDATWIGKIYEFNIYDGVMDETTAATRAATYLNASNASLASLSHSTGTLYPAFDSNITSYSILVDSGTASVDIDGTTVVAGANITSGNGTITLTGDAGSTDVVVTAEDGVTTKTYSITIKSDCFTPTFPSGNMVANPSMIGPFTALTDFSREWTNFDPKTDTEDACGTSFGSIYLKGTCYPNGGVLKWDSGVEIKPNTSYRILAKIKNETAASSDVFNFCLNSATWDLTTNDTTGNQTLVPIPTGSGWVTFDQTITTGPGAFGNVGFLIMSCDSADLGLIEDLLYIDHFEVYDESLLSASDFELNAASFSVFPNPSNGDSFKIALNSFEGSVNVKVYSILGKELLNKDFANSKTIEVNHQLNSGLYIVKVNDKATAKLVVK
ncbi:T9SS type A sorting domain-containing protein [Flavobacteriaceae bacterium SZ-1-7]|uniref:T9SS type A sorting domain-containing protein n=1 Tax=Tamlana sedimenti TaxID=3134126 RepID=UPI00312A06B9